MNNIRVEIRLSFLKEHLLQLKNEIKACTFFITLLARQDRLTFYEALDKKHFENLCSNRRTQN